MNTMQHYQNIEYSTHSSVNWRATTAGDLILCETKPNYCAMSQVSTQVHKCACLTCVEFGVKMCLKRQWVENIIWILLTVILTSWILLKFRHNDMKMNFDHFRYVECASSEIGEPVKFTWSSKSQCSLLHHSNFSISFNFMEPTATTNWLNRFNPKPKGRYRSHWISY